MKSIKISGILLLFTVTTMYAQVLNQDKDGRSTIFWNGTTISIDVSQPTASFNFNNSPDRLTKDKGWIYEINMKGKNEEGIASIIKDGSFVPSGAVTGRLGGYIDPQSGTYQNTLFFEGEIKTTSLYTFLADSSKGLDKWFSKQNFLYRRITLNYNFEMPRWLFGVGIGYQYSNNIGDLSANDYSFKEEYKIANQTVSKAFSRTAYSAGEYKEYESAVLNVDIMHFYSPENEKVNIAWNVLYVRSELAPTRSMTKRIDLGSGVYFMNDDAKLLGGIYVQWSDITNDRITDHGIAGNLAIGIVSRFALSSVSLQ